MKVKIYYSIMPHPSIDKYWGKNYYDKLHYKSPSIVVIKEQDFGTYWRYMIDDNIDFKKGVKRELERLWEKYNIYSSNPLSNDNDPLQPIVKKSGARHTSMSIGDVVKVGDDYYIAVSVGWSKIKFI